jgi:hypothetical protein
MPVVQNLLRRMNGKLTNSEAGKRWKDAILASFKEWSYHLNIGVENTSDKDNEELQE